MEINRDNYESFLLTYLDGELAPADKESVEKFLSENTDLQKEFSALKSMRLIPDEIYFDDKQSLLRAEEKRRVLPVYWLRTAAVLMLGIGGAWLVLGNLKIREFDKLKIQKDDNIAGNLKIGKVEKLKTESIAGSEKMGKIEKLKIESISRREKTEGREKPAANEKIKKIEKEKIESVGSAESIADIQKSTINTQPETAVFNTVSDTRQVSGPEVKMSSLAAVPATIPENNSGMIRAVSQSSDQSEDVSISLLSVNAKNTPVAGFFKKLLRNTGSDKSGRTVNVSVLQISY